MGIEIVNDKWVADSLNPQGSSGFTRRVINYVVDAPSDIAYLPGAAKIKMGSIALVISDAEYYILGSSGWVSLFKIPRED